VPVGQYRYDLGMATKRRVIGRNTTGLYPSGSRYQVGELADYYKAVQNAAIEQSLDADDEVTLSIKVDLSVGNNLGNILISDGSCSPRQ
jgi:hypothetical protein